MRWCKQLQCEPYRLVNNWSRWRNLHKHVLGCRGTTFDDSDVTVTAQCSFFNVSFPGLYLCLPASCGIDVWDAWDVWEPMLAKAGFDDCSDFGAFPFFPSPTSPPLASPSPTSPTSTTSPTSPASSPVIAFLVTGVVILVGAGFSYHYLELN